MAKYYCRGTDTNTKAIRSNGRSSSSSSSAGIVVAVDPVEDHGVNVLTISSETNRPPMP